MKEPSLAAKILIGTAILLGGVAAHDAMVPVPREITTRVAIGAIEGYRAVISPLLRGRVACRFEPTCSVYGLESIRQHGALRGGWKAARRLSRCTTATPMGTIDPP
ncbi:MAG: membrane protein insertion efficiency factor YidD [Thermoanaerobaculia bacterium]